MPGCWPGCRAASARVTSGATPPSPEQAQDFAFRRLDIDVSKAQAEACLVFTRQLDASGRTHYEDYLTIDPTVRVATRVVDTRLCLSGMAFDKTYNVTLKTGFPAATGEKLAAEETVPVELRDKPSLVRFAGGIILPRENVAGVPVTTVNIDKLTLKIIRRRRPPSVADRNRHGRSNHPLQLGQPPAPEQPGQPGVAGRNDGRQCEE